MGGFFPKVDEKYGDGVREYNWWGCSNTTWYTEGNLTSVEV